MSKRVWKVVEFRIHDGQLEDFRRTAKKFIDLVAKKEPNTARYEWFIDDDSSNCYIIEEYSDADSLLVHLDNIRHLYEQLFAFSEPVGIHVLGNATEAVRKVHLPSTKFTRYWNGNA